jgi:hypothetical protein
MIFQEGHSSGGGLLLFYVVAGPCAAAAAIRRQAKEWGMRLERAINQKPSLGEGFFLQTNERKKTNFSYAKLKQPI